MAIDDFKNRISVYKVSGTAKDIFVFSITTIDDDDENYHYYLIGQNEDGTTYLNRLENLIELLAQLNNPKFKTFISLLGKVDFRNNSKRPPNQHLKNLNSEDLNILKLK